VVPNADRSKEISLIAGTVRVLFWVACFVAHIQLI
jgi:hypothetical protein